MTPFVSVALYRRSNEIVFKPPRKERPTDRTQARKAAMRFWTKATNPGDKLERVALLQEFSGAIEISERGDGRAWTVTRMSPQDAAKEAHLAACLAEVGIDARAAPPPVPDVLVINGFTYRRDI